MVNPFIGQINTVGFNFAPRGWSLCEGTLLPISNNTALFSLIGTTFGGDGRTTFALPDLRGRSIVGFGNGPGLDNISWGERGGRISVTLTVDNMPSHTHALRALEEPGNTRRPGNNLLAGDASGEMYSSGTTADATMKTSSISNTGGGRSFNTRNPFLGLYNCIAMVGAYPSRS